MTSPSNRLAGETSPYLLQHADNPVDWQPWDEKALAQAKSENKPILLSIGYSACHWCHVMAHESFEDETIAETMNRLYVNIKVDREERPDLDRVYQTAHQILAQRGGGWPLTVFLDPDDKMPFFAGTYFPPAPRHGMPGFGEVLERVAGFYKEHHGGLRDQARELGGVLNRIRGAAADELPSASLLDAARRALEADFDKRHGGFGQAPKFPHPGYCQRLLRHWRASAQEASPDVQALYLCSLTMKRMAQGGLFDHLGGGFFRYSVDRYWMIPHFEKMLYDNAQLLTLYSLGWQASGDEQFREVAAQTADWMVREMQSDDGGYYSTLDADSRTPGSDQGEPKQEGAFYVWDRHEIKSLLDAKSYATFAEAFGLDGEPNFEHKHWHLHANKAAEMLDAQANPDNAVPAQLAAAQNTLFAVREKRPRPDRDEKIIAAWNGLAIHSMAVAARTLSRPDFDESARRAARFLKGAMYEDSRLKSVYKDGRARFDGYLDDHAFVLAGLIELLQNRWDSKLLSFAQSLADHLLDEFEDPDQYGFFFTAHRHEKLIFRPKNFADEALPSGNGIAALALLRLGWLLAEPRYLDTVQRTLLGAREEIEHYPAAHASLLDALEEWHDPGELVIIRGDGDEGRRWWKAATLVYAPKRQVYLIPPQTGGLPDALNTKVAGEGCRAYVCRGTVCGEPLESLEGLAAALAVTPASGESSSNAV